MAVPVPFLETVDAEPYDNTGTHPNQPASLVHVLIAMDDDLRYEPFGDKRRAAIRRDLDRVHQWIRARRAA